MKVYQITATVIIQDRVDEDKIEQLCMENIYKAVMEDFYIGNCITHYELKETIDYPDIPLDKELDHIYEDEFEDEYDNWIKKSQEVIDRIKMEMRNP